MRTVSKAVAKKTVVALRIAKADCILVRIVDTIREAGNAALNKAEALSAGKFQKQLKQVIDYQTRRGGAALQALLVVQRELDDASNEVTEAIELQE